MHTGSNNVCIKTVFDERVMSPEIYLSQVILVLASTVNIYKITVLFTGSFHQVLRVTDEDFVSKTTVLSIFILISIITALKGTLFQFLFLMTQNLQNAES